MNPSKPRIVFPYSKQRFLSLEPAKEENKNKCDYLTRAIALGRTPLSDEELTDFLESMRNATFGIVTDHNSDTRIDDLSQDLLSLTCTLTSRLYTCNYSHDSCKAKTRMFLWMK